MLMLCSLALLPSQFRVLAQPRLYSAVVAGVVEDILHQQLQLAERAKADYKVAVTDELLQSIVW
jgi:hypothetical protein